MMIEARLGALGAGALDPLVPILDVLPRLRTPTPTASQTAGPRAPLVPILNLPRTPQTAAQTHDPLAPILCLLPRLRTQLSCATGVDPAAPR